MQQTHNKPPPPGSAVYELTDLEGNTYIIEQDYLQENQPGEVVNFNIHLWSKEKTSIQGSSLPHSQTLPLDFQFTIEVQGEGKLQSTPGGQASGWTHISFLLSDQPNETTTIKLAIVLEQKGEFKTLPKPIRCIAKTVSPKTKRKQTSTQKRTPPKHDKTNILFNVGLGEKSLTKTKEGIMSTIRKLGLVVAVIAYWVIIATFLTFVYSFITAPLFSSKPMIPKKVNCETASAEKTPDGKYVFKDCELKF